MGEVYKMKYSLLVRELIDSNLQLFASLAKMCKKPQKKKQFFCKSTGELLTKFHSTFGRETDPQHYRSPTVLNSKHIRCFSPHSYLVSPDVFCGKPQPSYHPTKAHSSS
ncbi:hypothetical protein GOODEAATRI_008583 [Goodea atripinnis]|uniref:Uncharacterized protein n=1 Tax=Goodea atripinnis TaxID=208336 RepID=A0ABV0MZR4_9TELE